jgi:hypothetical protein
VELGEQSLAQILTFDQDMANFGSVGARDFDLEFRQVVLQEPSQRLRFVVSQLHIHESPDIFAPILMRRNSLRAFHVRLGNRLAALRLAGSVGRLRF